MTKGIDDNETQGVGGQSNETIMMTNGAGLTEIAEDADRHKDVQKRPTWSRKADFFIACLGGAVGLGNVWRFPYLCYKNGGGAFLIPYFLCLFFGSLPLVILEVGIGQYMGFGCHKAWGILPLFQGLGLSMTAVIFYVSCYYNVILAWACLYLYHSFKSHLPWDSCDGDWNTEQCSTDFVFKSNNATATNVSRNTNETLPLVDPATEFWEKKVLDLSSGLSDLGAPKWDLTLCLIIAWVLVYFCICKGIKSSGKAMYVTATAPYLFMTIILIRNATLDGAVDGISYYLKPNMTKLSEYSVWTDAGKQTFFSSCISQAILTTLGSYNRFKHNFCRDSIILAIINSFTSIFAGFLVFTTLGFMAFQQGRPIDEVAESGPGLVFIAYPKAVSVMPLPQLWSIVFFIMILLIGLDSQFLGVESVMTCCLDQFPNVLRRKRRKDVFIIGMCIVMFLSGLFFICRGGVYVFQLVDFYCSGKTIILLGVLEVVGIAHIYGFRRFYDNMVMMVGSKWMRWLYPYLAVCWLFFTPLVCLSLLILTIINEDELTYRRPNESVYYYPSWAHGVGWILGLTTVICIPGVALYRFAKHGFSMQVLRMMLVPYKLKQHQMRPQDKLERRLYGLEHETVS